jgi:flagellar hook-basal body complex protein FliE
MAFINKVNNLNNVADIAKGTNKKDDSLDFEKMLKNEIDSTNKLLQESEKAQADIATGQVEDLARASITIQKAEMKMKMMLEVRNKAINAYKELMKTQI